MITRLSRRILGTGIVLIGIIGSGGAYADSLLSEAPDVRVLLGTQALNGQVAENADGSFQLTGSQQGGTFNGGPSWSAQWNLTIKEDPFILGSFTLTNLTSDTKTFNFSLSLPVTPAFSSSVYGGSISATLLDANGDSSATLGPDLAMSPAIYRGTIDNAPILSLFGATLTCSGSGPGCSASLGDSNGLPGLTLAGPGVASSIGTLLSFSLSAGDSVTFLTNFTVEPPSTVPLPAALPLLLSGLGGIAAFRRRKRFDLTAHS